MSLPSLLSVGGFLRTTAIVVFITVCFDLVASQFLKGRVSFFATPEGISRKETTHPYYEHGFMPNVSTIDRWGGINVYTLKTNALGLRDNQPGSLPLKSDDHRVLLIGDSFTEGLGVNWEHSFAGRLQSAVAGQGIEVMNAGVSSYSPSLYYKKVRWLMEVEKLQVDEVIVLMDVNDVDDEQRFKHSIDDDLQAIVAAYDGPVPYALSTARPVYAFLMNNSMIFRMGELLVRYGRLAQKHVKRMLRDGTPYYQDRIDLMVTRVTSKPASMWTYDKRAFDRVKDDGLKRVERGLGALADMLAAKGVPMTLVVYPEPDQIFNDPKGRWYVPYFRNWSEKRNVRFTELFTSFEALGAPKDVLLKYFIPFDTHWNEAGHFVVAEALCRKIETFRGTNAACRK